MMIKKNLNKTIIFLFITIFSCAKPKIKPPYLLSEYPEINFLELKDHQACTSLKLNLDEANNLDSKLYWHCRLSFSKFHIEIQAVFPNQIEFNKKITDLITKISLIISKNQESNVSREINKIDENDHKKCIKLGYSPNSLDQFKIEEYYQCRKNLIELNYSEPPFSIEEYKNYQTKKYNIGFVIDKRIKKSFEENQNMLKANPECQNFRPYSDDFKKCIDSIEEYKQCLKNSLSKFREIEANEKIVCQRQAYIKYNDEMIRESERVDNYIKNRNNNADRDNKNNFESIGINEKDFVGKTTKKIIEEEYISKLNKINNTTNGIYSKQEISRLRKNFIINCVNFIDNKLVQKKLELNKNCESLKFTKKEN
jgi:hypothetical protein